MSQIRIPSPADYDAAIDYFDSELPQGADLQDVLHDKALSLSREVRIHLGLIARELRPHPSQERSKRIVCVGLAYGAALGVMMGEHTFGDASELERLHALPDIPTPSPQDSLSKLQNEHDEVSQLIGLRATKWIDEVPNSAYMNPDANQWFTYGASQVIHIFHAQSGRSSK